MPKKVGYKMKSKPKIGVKKKTKHSVPKKSRKRIA